MGWNGIEFNEARHNNMSSAALLALNPVFTLSLSFYEFIKPNVRYATKTNHIQVEQTRTTTRIANTSLCSSLRSDISSNFISKPWSLKSKTAATMAGGPKSSGPKKRFQRSKFAIFLRFLLFKIGRPKPISGTGLLTPLEIG